MELVELQCNDELKAKFNNSSPLSFFRDIALPSSNCRDRMGEEKIIENEEYAGRRSGPSCGRGHDRSLTLTLKARILDFKP